jgi:hypothetical protein
MKRPKRERNKNTGINPITAFFKAKATWVKGGMHGPKPFPPDFYVDRLKRSR